MADTTLTPTAAPAPRRAGNAPDAVLAEARWRRRAACRGKGPVVFFLAANPKQARANEQRAKKLCGACSVRAHCLAFALEHGEAFGVWGGLNANERLVLTVAEKTGGSRPKERPAAPTGRAQDGASVG